MPQVPTYDSAQVAPQNLPSVQITPPGTRFQTMLTAEQATLPGRQIQQAGNALLEAGGVVSRIATEEIQQANQVRVNDALNKLAGKRLSLTYSPEEGYKNLRGEAALKRPNDMSLDQEFGEKLITEANTLAGDLGNDAQRRMFQEQADAQILQFQGALSEHLSREYTNYQVSVQDGTIATAQQQLALSWEDPAAVGQARDTIEAAVYAKGQLIGLSPKQIEANIVEAVSPAHLAVVSSAVDAGNTEYAKAYLQEFRNEFTTNARLDAQKLVDAGQFEERTQDAAADLWAKHEGDMQKALAEARQRFSGKDEDAIVTRLKTLGNEREAIRTQIQRDATDAAWSIFADTGSIATVPPSVLSNMDGQAAMALRNVVRAEAAGQNIVTDSDTYYALTLAAATDPNFVNEDLRRYYDKLSPAHRQHFMNVQAALSEPETRDEMATVTQQKNTLIATLGLKDEQAGMFHQVADRALLAAQYEKGGNLTQEERQKVLDRLVIQGTTPTGWFGSGKDAFRFEAIANEQPFTPVWTDVQKRQATAALQRQGIQNPTQVQIEAVLQAAYGEQ